MKRNTFFLAASRRGMAAKFLLEPLTRVNAEFSEYLTPSVKAFPNSAMHKIAVTAIAMKLCRSNMLAAAAVTSASYLLGHAQHTDHLLADQ